MHSKWRGWASILGALLLSTSCAGAPTRAPLVLGRSIAVPAAPGSYMLFSPAGVELHAGTQVQELEGPGSGAGQPALAAVDLEAAMACVAYSAALVFVDLSSQGVTKSVPHNLGPSLRGAAISGNLATLWSDKRVVRIDTQGRSEAWDLDQLLRGSSVDYIDYCFPVDDANLLLVASKAQSAWSDGLSIAVRLDRTSGSWLKRNQNEIQGLSTIHRVASQGSSLLIAGLFEKNQLSVGGGARLWQDVLVFKLDPESLAATEVMRSPRQDRETIIRDLAVGSDSVSLLYHNGLVEIYKVVEGVRATIPSFDKHFPGAEAIAWVSENELLVTSGGRAESVRFQ